MLNRKKRQIETLQRRIATVAEQRDEAIQERDVAVRLNGRLAQKVNEAASHVNQAKRAWRVVARDADQAESLFARAMGVHRRREQRHHTVVASLRRELHAARNVAASERRRADKLAATVERLQQANVELDWTYGIYPKATETPAKQAA